MAPDMIVFDWDGTLCDSTARIVQAMQAAFQERGLQAPDALAVRGVIGLGLEAAIKALPGCPEALVAPLAADYRLAYARLAAVPSPLFAGVPAVLRALQEAGVLLGIATSKSRAGLSDALAGPDIGRYFVATRTADDCAAKPSPQMLEELLGEFSLRPQQALMVGDSVYDLRMAATAGVPAVACLYDVPDPDALLEFSPIATLNAIHELLPLLGIPLAEQTCRQ